MEEPSVPVLAAGFIELTEGDDVKCAVDATKIALIRVSDGQTLVTLVGLPDDNALFVAESPGAILRAIEKARGGVARLVRGAGS